MAAVSGYSVAHDVEVQQYNQMRAAIRASQEQAAREQRARNKALGLPEPAGRGRLWRRVFRLKPRNAGPAKDAQAAAAAAAADHGRSTLKPGGRDYFDGDDHLSDAETEVDMVQVLEEGDGEKEKGPEANVSAPERQLEKNEKKMKAPPYVFLQALPGVTRPLRRSADG